MRSVVSNEAPAKAGSVLVAPPGRALWCLRGADSALNAALGPSPRPRWRDSLKLGLRAETGSSRRSSEVILGLLARGFRRRGCLAWPCAGRLAGPTCARRRRWLRAAAHTALPLFPTQPWDYAALGPARASACAPSCVSSPRSTRVSVPESSLFSNVRFEAACFLIHFCV